MLASPVNVTIALSNGVALKANTAASDHSARREPQPLPSHQVPLPQAGIEPEPTSNSLLTHVNAVAATAGNRTILQELSLNVAAMLRIARRPEENLTALFLRIIARIEAMPQSERLQFEIRAGLKPLRITLSDLVMALRKPDGQEAARLTATAEAPTAVPGRTAANAATTTYLEEGTDTGHAEETLAMRAAARNSAAGQSVFSAENKIRPSEAQPADAKVLQNQLKTMFEPGEAPAGAGAKEGPANQGLNAVASLTDASDAAGGNAMSAKAAMPDAGVADPRPTASRASGSAGDNVAISSASLKLDAPTVEKIRNAAQAIASQGLEAARADHDHPAVDKTDDRRLQTMLTLKGLAEVVAVIPAKAAELLAGMVAEASAPLPEAAEESNRATAAAPADVTGDTEHVEPGLVSEDTAENMIEATAGAEPAADPQPDDAGMPTERAESQAAAAMAEDHPAANAERPQMARPDLVQHAVPFAYAQAQPGREEMVEAAEEEDARDDAEEDGKDEGEEGGEPRRPRDDYDAIHDPVAEEEPAITINRDSSEADRAFALYQRMGGF